MTTEDRTQDPIPGQRAGARHAAPRVSARGRLRGRALAMAAVPTALLMGAVYAPSMASADTPAGKACASAPDLAPESQAPEPVQDTVLAETPVPKNEITPLPGPSLPGAEAPATSAAPAPQGTAAQPPAAKSGTATGGQVVGAAYVVPVAGAAGTPAVAPVGLIGDIVGGIGDLLTPGGNASPSASPSPSPSAAAARAAAPALPAAGAASPAAGTATATTKPTGAAAPKATTGPKAAASSTAAAASASPKPTASPTANPNCAVDTSSVAARAAAGGDVVPEQNWTLRSSRLGLHGAVFNGVYDVRTVTGTKRVLKFTVSSVDIENLDMSTLEGNGKTFHVKGGPGTTSTMRGGPVTMYVERLSGHLSKLLGLPIPIDLGEITLTPDTLPRWLWDLIGAVPIPLDIELTKVEAVQAGQFRGTLKIPGMHLYKDDEPYTN